MSSQESESADLEHARLVKELEREHLELATVHTARDAAEAARGLAESARNAAEVAGTLMREKVVLLKGQVDFLEEQMRSTRAYLVEAIEPELVDLRAERGALLQEIAVMNEELKGRGVGEA
jgi:hypothetical protein